MSKKPLAAAAWLLLTLCLCLPCPAVLTTNLPGSGGAGGDADQLGGVTPSAYTLTLLDDLNASAWRTTLELAVGTNVQAYDADLTTWAGITPSANVQTFNAAANYAAMRTALAVPAAADIAAPVRIVSATGAVTGYGYGAATPETLADALWAARSAAISGDRIEVAAGNYTRSSGSPLLLKNGVNWNFAPGAVVDVSTTTQGSVWDDSAYGTNGAVTSKIEGHGTFKRSGCPSATDTYNVVLIDNPASNVTIVCDKISDENAAGVDGTYGIGNCGIRHSDGTLTVTAFDRITSINGVGYWWDSGNSYIDTPYLSGHSAIYFTPSAGAGYDIDDTYTAGEPYVQVKEMVGTGVNTDAGQSYTLVTHGSSVACWVRADVIRSPVAVGAVEVDGVKLYLLGIGKIAADPSSTANETILVTSGTLWATVQKLQPGRDGIKLAGGTSHIYIQHIDDEFNRADKLINCTGGEHYVSGQRMTGGTGGGVAPPGAFGVYQDGGSLKVSGYKITTTSSANPIYANTGDTLTVSDLELVANGAGASAGGTGTIAVVGSLNYNNAPSGPTLTYTSRVGNASTLAGSTPSATGLAALVATNASALRDAGGATAGVYTGAMVAAATTSAQGAAELAIASEINTGTDTTRTIGVREFTSSNYGKRIVQILVPGALTTGDAKAGPIRIPSEWNGWNIISVSMCHRVGSTSGNPNFQVRRVRAGSAVDVLSTALTTDAAGTPELDSSTAATPAVINGSNDDVATADQIFVDCDTAGTGTTDTNVTLVLQLP